MRFGASVFLIILGCMIGCSKSETPIDLPHNGDGDGDSGDGDGDSGDGDGDEGNGGDSDSGDGDVGDGDGDTGDGDKGDGDTGDGDTGDGDTGDGDTGDGDKGDGDTGDGDKGDGDTGDGDTGDGDTGDGDTGDGDGDVPLDTPGYEKATLTEFESYPTSDEECEEFSGCDYEGYFSAFPGEQKSEEWVSQNNIAAVHSDDFDDYVFKTLRLKYGSKEIDVVVYDQCLDSDCDGCCTRNKEKSGFLIDLESYTSKRFGVDNDFIEWKCLDCD